MSDDITASFVDPTANLDESDLEDLPSEPDSDDVTVSEEDFESDAEREWKESLQQLEMLLTMVIVPYAGKYFGRKFAYWGWKRYMEWQYPVKFVVTNKAAFRGTGVVAAAAPL
ncbi:hypothetical protein LTR99_009700 [Exophiala xenobiotica]|uniref:Uncharacterized protein n=1 Tax=Vermiconidia calcicola TaxID=1690605 RepID=A0AAV9Q0J7_9PEZI|nr:hypothetical protein H2202_005114 [Exophiala xenobiotica]KAK5530232.1 hypothetical protein LTR23_010452 [Chaetothyriales sp. CCFEE 6169]KAK5530538.1 hypothetical protein LTR25_009116 [Vermiconidia calcicola]KAK5192546.1 hypothetical protein LTR92_007721 [Exophiala xenobiotica]KAK5205405.1 hypothetical protein LTR41_008859 [Exophiala xenobiotica]